MEAQWQDKQAQGRTEAEVAALCQSAGYGVIAKAHNASIATERIKIRAEESNAVKVFSIVATSSEAILSLRPVTFHHKTDTQGIPQFGLIAEDVAEVNPDLIVRDQNGEIYTVRYDAVNAMLLNEFLKAHYKMQEQEATIARLKSTDAKQEATIAKQQKQIEALTAGLQKVSDQLQLSKPAPQTVSNRQ